VLKKEQTRDDPLIVLRKLEKLCGRTHASLFSMLWLFWVIHSNLMKRYLSEKRSSLLKKALSEHCVEQVHLSFGNHPQVIQIQKFVTLFVTISGRCLWYDGRG
jgi:hypothetical protein